MNPHLQPPHASLCRTIAGFIRCSVLTILGLSCFIPLLFGQAATPRPDAETTYDWLSNRLEERLAEMDWMGGTPAVIVADLDQLHTIFEHNAEMPIRPGGLQKIVTAAAALELLGPNFRFSTEVTAVHPDEENRSARSLLIRGNGDPSLSLHYAKNRGAFWDPFDEWAKILKKNDIRTVEEGIWTDTLAFHDQPFAPGWPLESKGAAWMPAVSALNLNHNCIVLDWHKSDDVGEMASFSLFPPLEKYIYITNNMRLARTPRLDRTYERVQEGNLIVASGELGIDSRATDWAAIEKPARYFGESLKHRLQERGIEVSGPVRPVPQDSTIPSSGNQVLVGVHFSPPLHNLLAQMIAEDRTLEAEVIFKALGRRYRRAQQPGSFENGQAAVMAFLDTLRITHSHTVLVDGSGLSSLDRMPVRLLVDLMHRMHEQPTAEMFNQLLPRLGRAPALAGRFGDLTTDDDDREESYDREPMIWIMTTSRDSIEGASGWLVSRTGHRMAFAIVVNDSRAPESQLRDQIEFLVSEIYYSGIPIRPGAPATAAP